jgi:Protein of unknown function (DUF3027)
VSPATTRTAEPDQACAEAVEIARAVAEADAGPGQVGPHAGTQVEGERVVSHLFESLSPGYVGWRWVVTVARASRSKSVTVSESVLLPGPDALLAPAWVPWTDRVRPGDLKAGDLMPAGQDDERLVPAVAIAGEAGLLDWDESDAWNLGPDLAASTAEADSGAAGTGAMAEDDEAAEEDEDAAPARPARRPARSSRSRSAIAIRPARVLSATGRDEAADRWHSGAAGPRSPLATSAPAPCLTCGFMVRLSGPLGRVFGVCANEFAPDDGRVVSVDHGCGAHSDGAMAAQASGDVAPAVDELGYDMLNPGATLPESVLETIDHEL